MAWLRGAAAILLGLAGLVLAQGGQFLLLLGALGFLVHDLDAAAHVRPQAAFACLLGAALCWIAGWRGFALLGAIAGLAGLAALGPAWERPRALSEADLPRAPGCQLETLRVAIANVEGNTPGVGETAAAIAALDIDLLGAVETTDAFMTAAQAEGLPTRLPLHTGKDFQATLWSAQPLQPVPWTQPGRRTRPAWAHLGVADLGGRPVGIAVLHLHRPLIADQEAYLAQLEAILAPLPPDRIIIGDFNATPWSHAMQDVVAASGARPIPGFRITWRGTYPIPLDGLRLPALIGAPIDHILTTPGLGVAAIDAHTLPGSVHHTLSATLQIPSAACGPLPLRPAGR